MKPKEKLWQSLGEGKWIENLHDSVYKGDYWHKQVDVEKALDIALKAQTEEIFADIEKNLLSLESLLKDREVSISIINELIKKLKAEHLPTTKEEKKVEGKEEIK